MAGCFICDGPHRVRDCSKCEKLATLVSEAGSDLEVPTRVNPLQLLGALKSIKGNASTTSLLTLNGKAM